MKPMELLRAEMVGVKELRNDLAKFIKRKKPCLITSRGKGAAFIVPYEDLIELVEIVEESKDAALKEHIRQARADYARGGGIPFDG